MFCALRPQYAWNTYNTIGLVYKKARFQGYTDATFATKAEQPVYYGIVGPVVHVEVGDTVQVSDMPLAFTCARRHVRPLS